MESTTNRRLSSLFTRSTSVTTTNSQINAIAPPVQVDKEHHVNSEKHLKILKEFREQVRRGLSPGFTMKTSAVAAVVDAIRHSDAIDDRKLLLEHALAIISRIPDGAISQDIHKQIIKLLYNDLNHPASTCISNKHAWRAADGSGNNIDMPDMGKAGTPYSRSVQQGNPLPSNQLPDPSLIFDTLLKREKFVEHPGGLSSLMFAFAALVIHSIFSTKHGDETINQTSSYVDLAPLYGNNDKDQKKIRLYNGLGLLKPDVFTEGILRLLPPAVCVLLVLFSRNHNYIATKIFEINERGTYHPPTSYSMDDPVAKDHFNKQEEELFQTARLINCGWFGAVVFSDYFSAILGLVRDGITWSLTPFDELRNDDHSLFERGRGNVCSVEFNCLYRWHATTSEADDEWTQKVMGQVLGGKPIEEVTENDFIQGVRKMQQLEPRLDHWTIGDLERQDDGYFKDEDLANILQNATEHPAAAFRARGTPNIMRFIEIMGINQNRRWGVCSLNDFRKFLGLKTFKSFLEWNSDKKIADAAEKLYGDINNLELYVGLQAEEAKPLVDGAGLCPGYTISRAILSDAIALTRGDRYFTHDFTPYNLTAWGFADCQKDPNAFGFGSTLGRLFLRTLPNHFTDNSVYAFFPLMTPKSMKENLDKLGVLSQYDIERPAAKKHPIIITGHARVASILNDKESFIAPYSSRVDRLKVLKGPGFFPIEREEQQAVSTVLNSPELVEQIGQYFYELTSKHIAENSYTLVGDKVCGVDLVQRVLRVVPIYWVATDLAGIQLKTKGNPYGHYTPSELFDALGDIYSFIFLDVEASRVMVLGDKVKKHIHKLLDVIKGGLGGTVGSRFSFSGIIGTFTSLLSKPKRSEYHDILTRLYELGHSTDQLANTILALMVTSSVELTLATTNAIDLYLDSDHIKDIAAIAKATDKKTQLNAYALEALRLRPTFQGVFRISKKDQTVYGQTCKKNDRIFLDIATSNLDGGNKVDITRSAKESVFADGSYNYIGEALTVKIVAEVMRAVFSLGGICRAPGQSGSLPRFQDKTRLDLCYSYVNSAQLLTPWPTSMSIQYDARQK